MPAATPVPKISVAVETRREARIARVTIDNPARLNCLGTAAIVALRQEFQKLADDAALRAVVLTGAGDRAFAGGADLNELGACTADTARLFITRLHQACAAIRACPVPVIARVNGFCLGAGLEVAASCDIRVAADTAVFGMPEVVMGLPSVIEAALLPGLIGWGRTREMLLTGMTYDAAEALAIGFVERIAAPDRLDAEVERLLDHVCRATPAAVRSQKALIDHWQRVSVDEGIAAGIDALSEAYLTGEPQAAIGHFLAAKRARPPKS